MPAELADVIILCGGLGTRLRSVLTDRPKPMAPIGEKPFLEILMDHFAAQGLQRFILCVGYKAESIMTRLSSTPERSVVFSQENEPKGTGGALKLCEPLCRSEVILVLNGDSFCALDSRALLGFHAEKKALATVAVVQAEKRTDGGAVRVASDGQVSAFLERGAVASAHQDGPPAYLNAGVYAFQREIIRRIPDQGAPSLEKDILPSLAGGGLYAFVETEKLFDIGTPSRLESFRRSYLGSRPPGTESSES